MAEKLKLIDVESIIEIAWMYQQLSLNGQLVDDIDSFDAKADILDLAQMFDEQWNKHTEEEREELDYLEEIEKYAKKRLLISYGKNSMITKLSVLMLNIDNICPDGEFRNKLLKEVEEEMDRVIKNEVHCEDKRSEMIGCIIDIFEDFLDEHNVYIPNKERDESDDGNITTIYGSDYSFLSEEIERTLINFGVLR